MNLVIDIGNSRVKWGLARAGDIESRDGAGRTEAWLDRLPLADADAIWLASVADPAAAEAVHARAQVAGVACYRLTATARFGALVNGYENPAELGTDRWMACIGAVERFDGSILIVDAGTALTLDWIDARRRHQGGLIMPGIATMRRSLAESTQLPEPTRVSNAHALGTSPAAAIEQGTLSSAVCLINELAARHSTDHRILTGGESESIRPHLMGGDWRLAPELVLEGLAKYANRKHSELPDMRESSQNT